MGSQSNYIYINLKSPSSDPLTLRGGGIFSTPLRALLSFCTEVSWHWSCFDSPFLGSNTGEAGGLTRETLNFFSSTHFSPSFKNCARKRSQKKKERERKIQTKELCVWKQIMKPTPRIPTIADVISSSVVPPATTVLWIRNLSLHCRSGGATLWACIVTAQQNRRVKKRNKKRKNNYCCSSAKILPMLEGSDFWIK